MLGIVIVNYNDWDNLRNCIASVSVDIPYKIYVVDNDSKFDSYVYELNQMQNVVLINSPTNLGYSRANNLGLEKALNDGCDYFLISNTDIIYNSFSISTLISFLVDPIKYDNLCTNVLHHN